MVHRGIGTGAAVLAALAGVLAGPAADTASSAATPWSVGAAVSPTLARSGTLGTTTLTGACVSSTDTKVAGSWTAVPKVTGYTIMYATDSANGNYVTYQNVPPAVTSASGTVAANTTFWLKVRANAGTWFTMSNAVGPITTTASPPSCSG